MTSTPLSSEYQQAGPLLEDLLPRLLGPRRSILAGFARRILATKKQKIFVVLSPWYNCPVAYYSMVLGAVLAGRSFLDIQFLLDDIPYPASDPVFESELAAITAMCSLYDGHFSVERLSRLPPSTRSEERDIVVAIAKRAVDYDLIHRIGNALVPYPPPADFAPAAEQQLVSKGLRLVPLWKNITNAAVLVPGGLVNGGALYTGLASTFGLRRVTFDAGDDTLYLAMDGIASHQSDNARSYAYMLSLAREEQDFAVARSRQVRAARESCGDDLMKIKFDSAAVDSFDVLLCMSFEGDTAAIGLDYIFQSAGNWIESTVIELNERFKNVRIAIRQHPDERFIPSHFNAEALARIAKLKEKGANVVVFDSHSNVSTYELARRSKVVVVGATTFGIEAAMLGAPVVVFRNSYYAHTDFVLRPEDREDYFRLIVDAIGGAHRPTVEQQDHAHLMYYVLEACNRIRGKFNPQPKDFLGWLQDDPMGSTKSNGFDMIIGAIAGEMPFAVRKHQELWAEHSAAAA